MKKIVSLLLVLVVSFGLLAACSGDSDTDTDASGTSSVGGPVADEGIISTEDVKYVDANGDAVYRVIRPEVATDADSWTDVSATTEAATYVFRQFKTKTNITVRSETDAKDGTDVYEILIGDTNRPETQKAKDYIAAATGGHKSDFIIATIGKKIVIYTSGEETLMEACKYFIENFAKAEGIPGGIKYIYKSDKSNKTVTINGATLANFKVIRKHYNESYITHAQIEKLVKDANEVYDYPLYYYEDAYEAEGEYEIVVGNANRPGVTAITNVDEYKITVSGKKVYINGGSVQATAIAVAEFNKLLSKGAITDADSVSGNYSTTVEKYDRSTYYTIKWADDFDGTEIDLTKWVHVGENAYSSSGFNGRTAVRSTDPSRVFVADGKFNILAGFDEDYYYGGMLMTDRTMLYKYGYLEMSAILPDAPGLWTSLWLDSRWHNQNGKQPDVGVYYDFEIDINECFGNAAAVQANCHKWPTALGEQEGYEHTSLDTPDYKAKRRTFKDEGQNFGDGFHTYGLLWDETQMTFTCDGEAYFSYAINTSLEDLDGFHALCYIRLSAAIGFAGNPIGEIIPDDDPRWRTRNAMVVDYVHLYQLNDGKQITVTGDDIFK